MTSGVQHPNGVEKATQPAAIEPEKAALVLEELDRILDSRFFKNALRSRQFLEYVVRQKVEGHAEQLKERTIGTEVFQRAPGYATGDDSVVRVQAGEVRRRLEQYYQSLSSQPAVRIELQPGSYSPCIHWISSAEFESSLAVHEPAPTEKPRFRIRPIHATVVVVAIFLLAAAGLLYNRSRATKIPPTAVERFWAPIFSTPQPVLICLAKPIVYRPSFDLYQRYAQKHPGSFQSQVDRYNEPLPLDPNENIPWSDMVPYDDYGVAAGDVYTAVRVSSFLGRIGKPAQVRIGANYSFEDLRSSPSVIVGAYNNKWTMQIMLDLHFSFFEDKGDFGIHEQVPRGRIWHASLGQSLQSGNDFAIVARLLDSKTGQFTIVAAGITGSGTEAAGEFVSNPEFLSHGLRGVPPNWQNNNMELILQTNITDAVPGPPQVVAYYTW